MIKNVSDEMVEKFAIVGSDEEVNDEIVKYKDILDLPILIVPHYYLNEEKLEFYQNQILETLNLPAL